MRTTKSAKGQFTKLAFSKKEDTKVADFLFSEALLQFSFIAYKCSTFMPFVYFKVYFI